MNDVCQAAAQGSSAETERASWANGQVQYSQCAYIPTIRRTRWPGLTET